MKKTFQLRIEGKHPDRLLESIKNEIRKYVQRERRRALPEGVDFCDFDCRFGATEDTAQTVHEAQITDCINAIVASAGTQFYVEILAKPGIRRKREVADSAADATSHK